ncbi:MAG: tRNA (adenosine(37)-N6)-threonylcarbamoyltransferase complex dimerization subunit type 1 TsaB [Chloroflexi bacterium]|nr:tRNA (adenosine(37)-N6)-threonylcarbamoyltransferase complex dimerization subunit type 1 TsaB [Chloroflexota bacterium]
MLLAIDTASRYAGLALFETGALLPDPARAALIAEQVWFSQGAHTTEVMPRLATMFGQHRLTMQDITAIGVSIGPGSFTGMRIGLSVAKGLILGRDIPLVGIPGLDALAQANAFFSGTVYAVVEAGRGRLCLGVYSTSAGAWHRQAAFRLLTWQEMLPEVTAPALVCGEIPVELRRALAQPPQPGIWLATAAGGARRPAFLAEVAAQRLLRGERDDPGMLAPIYLHHTPIEEASSPFQN